MGPINDRLVGPLSDRLTGLKRALLIVSDAFLQSGLRCVHCPYQRFFIEEDFDHAGTHLNSLLSLSICLDALQNRLSSAGRAITVMAISNLHPGRAWLAQRYLCSQRESDPVLALAAIFMSLRNSIKLKILRGQYMIFLYDNRHQAPLKDCFSAFSNFVHAPLCRLLVLGGCEPLAYAKVCLGLLVWGAYGHLQLFSAIRNTDSHRDYSTNEMDFTPMSAHGGLAGYRNLFLHWPANLYFCLVRWVVLKVEKGLIFSGAAHA